MRKQFFWGCRTDSTDCLTFIGTSNKVDGSRFYSGTAPRARDPPVATIWYNRHQLTLVPPVQRNNCFRM
eukprot:2534975-Rhodomonas_salina.1